MIGCRKENFQPNGEISDQSLAQKPGKESGCRVTSFDYYVGVADEHQVDYYTYKSGLVDEWAVWYGGVYKMEYDQRGKLEKSGYYVDDVLVYSIDFIYEKDKVVKEVWYKADTKDIDDAVFYTFDTKGRNTRRESFLYDFYTDNTYTADGDLLSWKLYVGGSPLVSGHYTYYDHYRSPFVKGTPGIAYNFPYSNPTFGYTKRWYSSEKMVVYDELGTPSVYYDEEPGQTQWHTDKTGVVELVDYVDGISGPGLSVGFEYENCRGGDSESNVRKVPPVRGDMKKISPRSLLQHYQGKSLKEQVIKFRQQIKSQKLKIERY
jgi:hypothetical protein